MNINSRTSKANFTGFASGSTATFTGLRVAPAKVRAYINAIQSGTGDPAPDNIRPISPRNNLILTVNSIDHPFSFDDIYKGYLDIDTGLITITHNYIEYDGSDDENWTYQNNGYTISRPTGSTITSAATMCYSNQAIRSGATSMPNGTIRIGASNLITRLGTDNADVPTFRNWLAEHPLQVVYPLATPITVQLTPTEISQIIGSNSITSDSGNVEVYYVTI